jgi:hypothetical protein
MAYAAAGNSKAESLPPASAVGMITIPTISGQKLDEINRLPVSPPSLYFQADPKDARSVVNMTLRNDPYA